MRRIIFSVLMIGLGAAFPADALEITVETKKLGPFGVSNRIYLSGPINNGDAEKFKDALGKIDIDDPSANLHLIIHSPGGSITEALKMGRLLNAIASLFPATVTSDVGIRGDEVSKPGDCASACVLIYLGGTYRFLQSGSRIGVHQFYFDGDKSISSSAAVSVSQLLAAEVTEYLREVRADASLFSEMAKTGPEDINWVDRSRLEELRVVTNHIYDQGSEYKNLDGIYYLLLWQKSYYGENKITAACIDGEMFFQAYLQPPDLTSVPRLHELTVLVDGEEFVPFRREKPAASPRFELAAFALDAGQLMKFATAKTIGARMMVPGAPVFWGFEMKIPDNKLRDTITGCESGLRAQTTSRSPNAMNRLSGFDFTGGDLLPSGVRGITLQACEAVCQAEPSCLGISYVSKSQWCWPKKSLSAPQRAEGVVSSVKP